MRLCRNSSDKIVIQMPTKREINIHEDCVAVVGRVSNINHHEEEFGSAAGLRRAGIRFKSGADDHYSFQALLWLGAGTRERF